MKLHRALLIAAALLTAGVASAQNKTVGGTVSGDGETLVGATVLNGTSGKSILRGGFFFCLLAE